MGDRGGRQRDRGGSDDHPVRLRPALHPRRRGHGGAERLSVTEELPVLALDVGGTKLAAGVVTPDGTMQSFCQVATAAEEGPAAVVTRLLELGELATAEAGLPGGAMGE